MDVGAIFKSLFFDVLMKIALGKLFEAIPALAWGPIGLIVGAAASFVGNFIFDAVAEYVKLEQVAFKNERHRKAFDDAAVKLKIIGDDKGIDSQEFKEARKAHALALSEFVRFN